MNYIALENFSGIISMAKGQVREIPNSSLANDLVKAGFIKKYVADNTEALNAELDNASKKMAELEEKNNKLIEQIAELTEKNTELENLLSEAKEADSDNASNDAKTKKSK